MASLYEPLAECDLSVPFIPGSGRTAGVHGVVVREGGRAGRHAARRRPNERGMNIRFSTG